MKIELQPVAYVENDVNDKKDSGWGDDISVINLESQYYGGLKGLEEFSHVIIVFYLDKAHFDIEKNLQRHPRNRDDMPLIGIFSQRAKDRPNSIGITSAGIVSVHKEKLVVKGLDAVNGTPVLDIKPYCPNYDMKENAKTPEWIHRLMENYF